MWRLILHCIEKLDEPAPTREAVANRKCCAQTGNAEQGDRYQMLRFPIGHEPPDHISADQDEDRAKHSESTEDQPAEGEINPFNDTGHVLSPESRHRS